ncbi:hypothetical protein Tco_1181320, partial [Tanacetum coccineum]
APGNSSGGSPEVVKDGMEIGCVDPKVVEEMEEPMSIITKSFVSLVIIEAGKSKVDEKNASKDDLRSNFRPLFIGECPSSVGRVG